MESLKFLYIKRLGSINRSQVSFLEVSIVLQPAVPLAVSETGGEQWTEAFCRNLVNHSPEVAITGYVLNVVQIHCITLNRGLLPLDVTTE